VSTARHWILNCRGERVPTNPNFASYLVELDRYIQRRPGVRFFQTSRDGARIAGCAEHPHYMQ
jgi:protein-disulfide isomerase-like protein with CxxC motif